MASIADLRRRFKRGREPEEKPALPTHDSDRCHGSWEPSSPLEQEYAPVPDSAEDIIICLTANGKARKHKIWLLHGTRRKATAEWELWTAWGGSNRPVWRSRHAASHSALKGVYATRQELMREARKLFAGKLRKTLYYETWRSASWDSRE